MSDTFSALPDASRGGPGYGAGMPAQTLSEVLAPPLPDLGPATGVPAGANRMLPTRDLSLSDPVRALHQVSADLTLRRPWATADVGDGGSLCMKLYVKADPDGDLPEYLVCATPPAQGTGLTGRLLRNRANGLPRTVAPVVGAVALARKLDETRTAPIDTAPKRTTPISTAPVNAAPFK